MESKQQHTPINILLADDDTDDCIFFKVAVDEFPLSTHLTAVHDGEQLMQLLTNETNELPHILFLDLNMPRKNGFECLSELKLSKKLKQLPVIIFSTSLEQEVVNLLYKSGAQYFIRKPSEFSQFKKIIQQTLTLITQENISPTTKENFVLTVENSLIILSCLRRDKKELR
jgi:CheY-like chemotaxis protein